MKVTEVTPPQERKFTIELSEDEMYQLLAITDVFNRLNQHNITELWQEIKIALGLGFEFKRKYEVLLHSVSNGSPNLSLVPRGDYV